MDHVRKGMFDGMKGVIGTNDLSITHNSTHIWQISILLKKGHITHGTISERWKAISHYDLVIFNLLITHNFSNSILAWLYNRILEISNQLVVDLGEDLGLGSDQIELDKLEDCITKSEATWTYLKEGGLLQYMEGMGCYDGKISIQFLDT